MRWSEGAAGSGCASVVVQSGASQSNMASNQSWMRGSRQRIRTRQLASASCPLIRKSGSSDCQRE